MATTWPLRPLHESNSILMNRTALSGCKICLVLTIAYAYVFSRPQAPKKLNFVFDSISVCYKKEINFKLHSNGIQTGDLQFTLSFGPPRPTFGVEIESVSRVYFEGQNFLNFSPRQEREEEEVTLTIL